MTIGKTIRELPGMMIPNDKYHDYFDANGVLINDPMKDAEEENGDAEPDELNEMTGEPQTEDEPTAEEARTEPEPERAEEEKPEELAKREAELNKRETEIMEKEALLVQRLKEAEEVIQHYKDSQRELDSIVMVRLIQKTKAEKDHIELLRDILYGYFELIEKQAGKKSAMPMSRREIRKINELLSEIRETFRGCETEEYLTLANEPSPPDSDHKDSEEEQGTTYGEMAIILRTYHCTMHAFSCGRLHMKEEITEEDTEMI